MLTLLTVVLTFMLTLRLLTIPNVHAVVNLLTFKGLLSRVGRGKGKRRDQPRPQLGPSPHNVQSPLVTIGSNPPCLPHLSEAISSHLKLSEVCFFLPPPFRAINRLREPFLVHFWSI